MHGGDAVLENIAKYERIGRKFAFKNARFQGVKTRMRQRHSCERITQDSKKIIESIIDFDEECFTVRRRHFLEPWLMHHKDSHSVVISHSRVEGFGTIRKAFEGWKIGPLFARNTSCAREILHGLLDTIEIGEKFTIDVPTPNTAAMHLAAVELEMKDIFYTARMFTGEHPPKMPLQYIYGLTSFEIG